MPLLVAAPDGADPVAIQSLVDTGADCTPIPVDVARRLRLPLVDRVAVEGLGGAIRRAPVYASLVRLPGLSTAARLIAFENEAIVGRDLLNRLAVVMDGPRLRLSVR